MNFTGEIYKNEVVLESKISTEKIDTWRANRIIFLMCSTALQVYICFVFISVFIFKNANAVSQCTQTFIRSVEERRNRK
jgi:hypothetical protein